MKRYQINLSEEQLALLSKACETYARIEMNQLDMVSSILISRASSTNDIIGIRETLAEAESTIDNFIAPRDTNTVGALAWDLYQVFRHRLAWDRAIANGTIKEGDARKWPEMMQVYFDDPMQTHTSELVIVKEVGQ